MKNTWKELWLSKKRAILPNKIHSNGSRRSWKSLEDSGGAGRTVADWQARTSWRPQSRSVLRDWLEPDPTLSLHLIENMATANSGEEHVCFSFANCLLVDQQLHAKTNVQRRVIITSIFRVCNSTSPSTVTVTAQRKKRKPLHNDE